MSLYNENGERINTAAIFESMEYDQDAQQIESGAMYEFVYDLLGICGGLAR